MAANISETSAAFLKWLNEETGGRKFKYRKINLESGVYLVEAQDADGDWSFKLWHGGGVDLVTKDPEIALMGYEKLTK